ncbi:transposon Ty3-G Gag-Pol polyprotein [Nephila pilipes]|uniref:Transposon Ty3-G Gag-Pol polyprotein n=1 Tax=Nephila pilipes TaxID=299642 RepID=A0A8X6Q073_NEPPI|nr:transposon Ty3-G Gag-Pol polyprotein [Nephila pilipes]
MQFGLCNASSTFQRFIDGVTRGLNGAYAFVDDILIASQSYEVYIEHLQGLFFTSDHYRLTINLSKCTFGVHTFDFTGFTVSNKAGHSNEKKSLRLTKKSEASLQWSEEDEKAFTDAKKALAEATLLRHPILDAPLSYWTETIKPLIFAFKHKREKCSPRQLRHLDCISQFSTAIRPINGKDNIIAGVLLRIEIDAITTPSKLDYKMIAKEQV